MARKPRLHVPGGIYHVILRGNAGQDIFFARQDRSKFLLLTQEGVERYDCRIHAFCLMTNHVHLVIQVGHYPLAKIIQNLSFRYTRFINKRKKRMGHLFQGRYKAFLVDADTYLLELVRYIHNNPLRAKMAKDADTYPWTSHRVYSGAEELPWLTTELVLGQFSGEHASARKFYREFVGNGAAEGHRSDFYGGEADRRVIGDDSFIDAVLGRSDIAKPPSLQAVTEKVCRNYGVTLQDLRGQGRSRKMAEVRGIICWLAQRFEAASVGEVAALFGRDLSTMSRSSGNIDKKMRMSAEYGGKIKKILGRLG